MKNIDKGFDKNRKEITDLYNQSVEYYRQGELEKARDGFSQVAKSGVLIAPKGQTAEDYLLQIDSILTQRMSPGTKIEKAPQPALEPSNEPTPQPAPLETPQQSNVKNEAEQQEEQLKQQAQNEISPRRKTPFRPNQKNRRG